MIIEILRIGNERRTIETIDTDKTSVRLDGGGHDLVVADKRPGFETKYQRRKKKFSAKKSRRPRRDSIRVAA
jgi:hypothetical protein